MTGQAGHKLADGTRDPKNRRLRTEQMACAESCGTGREALEQAVRPNGSR